jgi:HEPN domain-containing protein
MDKLTPQHELLFNKSRADYQAAGILFKSFNDGNTELDLDIILFHLQQSAEKAFKAILSKYEIHYPKTHDLESLINLLNVNQISMTIDRDIFLELSDYAVEGRYSIIHDDIENIQSFFSETQLLLKQSKHILYN